MVLQHGSTMKKKGRLKGTLCDEAKKVVYVLTCTSTFCPSPWATFLVLSWFYPKAYPKAKCQAMVKRGKQCPLAGHRIFGVHGVSSFQFFCSTPLYSRSLRLVGSIEPMLFLLGKPNETSNCGSALSPSTSNGSLGNGCCFLGQSPHDPVSCFPWRYTAHPQSIHESPSNKYHVARYGFVMVCPILRWPVSPEGLFNHQTQAVATPQSRSSPQIAHSSMPCPPNAPVAPQSGNRNWRWISGDPRESNIAKLICGYHMRMVNFQVLPGLVDYHCLGTIL